MDNYTAYTKTLSNLKLFEILENKTDYKEESIHAAQIEWDNRKDSHFTPLMVNKFFCQAR